MQELRYRWIVAEMLRYPPKDEIYAKADVAFLTEAAVPALTGKRQIVLDGNLPADLDEALTREIEYIREMRGVAMQGSEDGDEPFRQAASVLP